MDESDSKMLVAKLTLIWKTLHCGRSIKKAMFLLRENFLYSDSTIIYQVIHDSEKNVYLKMRPKNIAIFKLKKVATLSASFIVSN